MIIIYIGLSIIGRQIIKLTYSSPVINPSIFFNFVRVRLSSSESLNVQVTWLNEDRRIRWRADHRASMKWTRGPPIDNMHL